jgi:hypothetical protein
MRRLSWLLAVAFFFLNPGFACGPAEPQFNYSAADMLAAVEGTWSFTIMPEGAANSVQVTVKVEQAAMAPGAQARAPARFVLVRTADACGVRTLVKSAGACVDLSEMPLTVTYLTGDSSFANAPLSGTFLVNGTDFAPANTDLELVLGGYHVHAQVFPDGTILNAGITPMDARGTLTVVTHA